MSKPNFHLCDICGARVPERLTLFVATDRSFNGVESVTDGKYLDLCHEHLHDMVNAVLKQNRVPDYDIGNRVLGWYGKQSKANTTTAHA